MASPLKLPFYIIAPILYDWLMSDSLLYCLVAMESSSVFHKLQLEAELFKKLSADQSNAAIKYHAQLRTLFLSLPDEAKNSLMEDQGWVDGMRHNLSISMFSPGASLIHKANMLAFRKVLKGEAIYFDQAWCDVVIDFFSSTKDLSFLKMLSVLFGYFSFEKIDLFSNKILANLSLGKKDINATRHKDTEVLRMLAPFIKDQENIYASLAAVFALIVKTLYSWETEAFEEIEFYLRDKEKKKMLLKERANVFQDGVSENSLNIAMLLMPDSLNDKFEEIFKQMEVMWSRQDQNTMISYICSLSNHPHFKENLVASKFLEIVMSQIKVSHNYSESIKHEIIDSPYAAAFSNCNSLNII